MHLIPNPKAVSECLLDLGATPVRWYYTFGKLIDLIDWDIGACVKLIVLMVWWNLERQCCQVSEITPSFRRIVLLSRVVRYDSGNSVGTLLCGITDQRQGRNTNPHKGTSIDIHTHKGTCTHTRTHKGRQTQTYTYIHTHVLFERVFVWCVKHKHAATRNIGLTRI